jgi:hypothetical protein
MVDVQFLVGTINIDVEDTSSPFSIFWDSTGVSDGASTLYAVVRDIAGNTASTSVSVTVTNTDVASGGTSNAVGGFSGGGNELPKTAAAQIPQSSGISDGFKFTKKATSVHFQER